MMNPFTKAVLWPMMHQCRIEVWDRAATDAPAEGKFRAWAEGQPEPRARALLASRVRELARERYGWEVAQVDTTLPTEDFLTTLVRRVRAAIAIPRNLDSDIHYLEAHRQEVPRETYEALLAAFRERMDDPNVIVIRPRSGEVVKLPPAREVLRAVLTCMRTLGAGRPLFVADIRAAFPRALWAKDLSNLDRLTAWLICHQGIKVDGAALYHIGEGAFELSE